MNDNAQQQITLTIDGRAVAVPKGTLILKAAEQLGIEIPVFCYHDKLHPIGACRMCIVDVEGLPKPVPSCATEVTEGMVVHTRTPEVAKTWESVLEFLLINHPLDCPVCDRGGECPLQDNTFKYGPPDSRFTGEKRHFAKPVPLSALVLLDRERCIMCTRCVRFCEEISGHEEIKIWDRGHGEYIDTFPGQPFESNFSGNTIELCPVGALLGSVFRFRGRPWEIKSTPSVCPHCATGCNIRVDVRDNRELVRFLSRENADVDDGWLCDRGRFDSDFPNSEARLETPLARKNGELVPVGWNEALDLVAEGLRRAAESGPASVGAIGSPWRTNEENYLLQKLFRTALGTNNLDFTFDSRPGGAVAISEACRDGLFDGSIRDIAASDAILVIGSDISVELPVVDLWLKKASRNGAKLIYACPFPVELTRYSTIFLAYAAGGEADLVAALAGTNDQVAGMAPDVLHEAVKTLSGARRVLVLVSLRAFQEEGGDHLLKSLRALKSASGNTRICGVAAETNAQGAMDVGMLPGYYPGYRRIGDGSALAQMAEVWGLRASAASATSGDQMLAAAREGNLQALYLMGQDPAAHPTRGGETADALARIPFLVVSDTFLTKTASLARVVLPGCTFAEKEGTFTNTERRVQRINPAIRLRGESQPDWMILCRVAERLGAPITYDRSIRIFEEMTRVAPQYAEMDYEVIGEKGLQWGRHETPWTPVEE